jgi:hypothetical protein
MYPLAALEGIVHYAKTAHRQQAAECCYVSVVVLLHLKDMLDAYLCLA